VLFNFRMVDREGADVGVYCAAVSGPWPIGTELYEGGWAAWRITADVTPSDFDFERFAGVWEVEPVAA
jgi:hypothetical protein